MNRTPATQEKKLKDADLKLRSGQNPGLIMKTWLKTSSMANRSPRSAPAASSTQDALPQAHQPAGPKIGLALGGGIARGWAHIGVIERLIEEGIHPDIVTGTSVGALVGACYLDDKLDTLKAWTLGLTRRSMLGYMDIRLRGGGLLAGERLGKKMKEHLGDLRLEDLKRPFVAVAAELATGHEIWLREGPAVPAIRASYALPGAFAPVKINDRWLIDGAMVNPVPVSVCRALGARLVIAVSLNGDSYGSIMAEPDSDGLVGDDDEEITTGNALNRFRADRLVMKQLFGSEKGNPGMGKVMLGALGLIMDRLGRSRMAGDPPDVYVIPRIGHIGLMDFTRAEELIAQGYRAMDTEMPVLKHALRVLS